MQEFDDKFEKMMEEFRNRTIYNELSLEILATIPDDKIELTILDYIDTKIPDHRLRFNVISRMPEGFQMVYSTMELESQVNNGGFNQFFFNPSGQFAQIALWSLKLIGALDYYGIL
jgi:hypothetical protein